MAVNLAALAAKSQPVSATSGAAALLGQSQPAPAAPAGGWRGGASPDPTLAGTLRIDGRSGASGDPNAVQIYYWDPASNSWLNTSTGEPAPPESTPGLVSLPPGFKATGPNGAALTYDPNTGAFVDGSGTPATPGSTKITSATEPYTAILTNLNGNLTPSKIVDAVAGSGPGSLASDVGLGGLTGGVADTVSGALNGGLTGGGNIDTSAIANAAAASSATGANLLAKANNYVGGTAEQLAAAQAQAAMAAQGAPITAGQAQAALAAQGAPITAGQAKAALAAQGAPIAAGTYGGANIGP